MNKERKCKPLQTLYLRSTPALTRDMKYLLLLNETIDLRFIRVVPTSWLSKRAFRFDVIGCIKRIYKL